MDEGIEKQTHQAMRNLIKVLNASGSNLYSVLKTTIYLSDMKTFTAVNKIYGSNFDAGHYPARATVEVSRLPKSALIEINAIAAQKID